MSAIDETYLQCIEYGQRSTETDLHHYELYQFLSYQQDLVPQNPVVCLWKIKGLFCATMIPTHIMMNNYMTQNRNKAAGYVSPHAVFMRINKVLY